MSAPRARSHRFVGFVLVAACGLGASAACSPDPTPRGFHSPDLAWADDELGLVWLDRNAPYEHVVFARAGLDAKLKAPPFELSQHAWHSDPPLVASDGRGWLAAWTQAGGRAPGLRVRQVGPGGPEGPVRTIVEATVSLCPKLAWTGDAYVVGWREGDGLYLGRVGSHGLLEGPPQRVAETSSIDRCRVALGDDELGVLWSGSQDEDHALALARVSLAGELRDVVEVVTDAPPAAGPIDLAWHDGAWVVAYTSPERAGARTVRVTPSREQAPGPALAREGFVRGLALASAGWLGAAWSETTRAGASRGRIFFDLLARAGEPLELGAGRPWVNASVHDRQLAAVTWSRVASGTTTVHWSVIRLRQDGEALVSEISLADQ